MLILQALDIENFCQGIYDGNSLKLEPSFLGSIKKQNFAWKHAPLFDNDEDYTYLFIGSGTRPLSDYSDNLELFQKTHKVLQAQKKAISQAKIEIENFCFFDIIPRHQLTNWLSSRHRALLNLYRNFEKPDCYNILHKGHVLTENISRQKINFEGKEGSVKYDIFGSVTGRLTTKRESIPVLTMKKEKRALLKPNNLHF